MISKWALRRYVGRGEKLFAAVSGGKDSVALLHSLWRLLDDLDFQLFAFHINLGIPRFSEESQKVVEALSGELGVPLILVDLEEDYGFTVPEASRATGRNPCSVCGIVKRYLENRVPRELGADIVATGHNADDFSKFALKDLYMGEATWLSKISYYIPGSGLLLPKIRPLIHRTREEILKYVEENGLPHVGIRCPLSPRRDRFSEIIRAGEEIIPGFRKGIVRGAEKIARRLRVEGGTKRCSICGEPSSTDPCSFCRIRMEVGKRRE